MQRSKQKNNYDDLTYIVISRCERLRDQVCRELNWMTTHPHTESTHDRYLVSIDIALGTIGTIQEVACWANEEVCSKISNDAAFLKEMVIAFQKLTKIEK